MDPKVFGLPSAKPGSSPGEVFQKVEPAPTIMIGVQELAGGFKVFANADANHPLLEAVASTPRQAAKRAADLLELLIKQNRAAANSGPPGDGAQLV